MRTFIVLCLLAVACADNFGYDYRPATYISSGLSFTTGSDSIDSLSSSYNAPYSSDLARLFSGSGVGGDLSKSVSYNAPNNYVQYEKEFYTFKAPEDAFDDPKAAQKIAAAVKNNIRVIFIKNPENKAYENAVLALAKQAIQQNTAIYVLNKQHDIASLAEKFKAIQTIQNNKPVVHFVKYRTHEDAVNAHKAIQSKYDSLGGLSQIYNGGIAPVLNFASQAPSHIQMVQVPRIAYLPPSEYHRFYLKN